MSRSGGTKGGMGDAEETAKTEGGRVETAKVVQMPQGQAKVNAHLEAKKNVRSCPSDGRFAPPKTWEFGGGDRASRAKGFLLQGESFFGWRSRFSA